MSTRRETWRPTARTETIGQVVVLTMGGRLGDAGVREPALRAALTDAQAARALVVDISGVDYLSSPGLALLERLAADAAAAGQALVVCGMAEPVRTALALSGLSSTLACVDSRELAMERLTALMSVP